MGEAGLILGGRYRLRARIGSGGMGEVWWGTDLVLRRVVAVKLVRPDHARDEEGRARFRAESRHAAALAHRNIVHVYDYGEAGTSGLDYLVMEYIDGPCLAQWLDDGPLDPAQTMNVVAQAAQGLQAAHEAGVVHRDIKPANLLVSRDGRVAVTDFGIAHAAGSVPVTRAGMVMGTPAYLAPERVYGDPATPATDLYALGVVAYECLSGKIPFDGEPLAVAAAHVEGTMPPLPSSVPADVARLVADLTARDPAARPAHAAEVAARAEQLRAALSQPGGAIGPVRSVEAAGPVRRVRPVRVVRPVRPVRPFRAGRPVAGGILPPGHATVTLRPAAGAQAGKGGTASRSRGARTLARTALPMGGLAVAGLIGWVLATGAGPGPARQPSAAPAASSPALGSPGTPSARSHSATHRAGGGGGQRTSIPARTGVADTPAPVAGTPAAAVPGGPPAPAAAASTKPLPPGQAKRLARALPTHGPKGN